jgi:protein-S-isoprenylcysteine O-methyltransferase Ste14
MKQSLDGLLRWLSSTPHRTFIVYPGLVLLFELGRRRSPVPRRPAFLLLLPWGYLQYELTGRYRATRHAGSRGFANAPDRLLTDGPYRLTRNPMYLGHLIFLLGLALTWRSRLGWLILLCCLPWFHQRVLQDEDRLRAKFGDSYIAYQRRVRRWLPFVL